MRASNSVLKSVFSVKDIYRLRFPIYLRNTALHCTDLQSFMEKCHAR